MQTYFEILQFNTNIQKKQHPCHRIKGPGYQYYRLNHNYWKDIFQSEFISSDSTDFIIKFHIFMLMFVVCKHSWLGYHSEFTIFDDFNSLFIKKKYDEYKKIMDNRFLNSEHIEKLQNIFQKTQKTYFVLKRFFLKVIEIHRKTKYMITTDLWLNPIDPNDKNTFVLYEKNQKFLFNIKDLVNIIYNAITNSDHMFEKPLQPKNPYTNIIINKNQMYSLFYKMYQIGYLIPSILVKYYKYNFDFDEFILHCQPELRDIIIHRCVTKSPACVLYNEIMEMIDDNFYSDNLNSYITIHSKFPKALLIEIMRPYLYLYLYSISYIKGTQKSNLSSRIFMEARNIFIRYNPQFGKMKKKRSTTINKIPVFNFELSSDKLQNTVFEFNNKVKEPNPDIKDTQTPPCFWDKHPKFSMNDARRSFIDPKIMTRLRLLVRNRKSSIIENDDDDEVILSRPNQVEPIPWFMNRSGNILANYDTAADILNTSALWQVVDDNSETETEGDDHSMS